MKNGQVIHSHDGLVAVYDAACLACATMTAVRISALTTEEERKELLAVGKQPLHLKYIGKQEFPGYAPLRMWNIIQPGNPYHQSTRTLEGLIELGIINAISGGK